MTLILISTLGLIMTLGAIFAILSKKLVTAIVAAGVISLLASVIYLLLAAPDVAMTEASIGSGLTTIVFLYALNRIRKINKEADND